MIYKKFLFVSLLFTWSAWASDDPAIDAEFIKIEAGEFIMGSPESEWGRQPYEVQHLVKITADYWLQTTEVTQAQWVKILGNNPSKFKEKKHCPETHRGRGRKAMCPDLPVEYVSWENVQYFIGWLNRKSKKYRYRLPSEAEWEYAQRAGTTTPFSFRNYFQADEYAWTERNSGLQTNPVGTKLPNDWGLFNMHGNVSEWVEDQVSRYEELREADPVNCPDYHFNKAFHVRAEECRNFGERTRMSRGGSWTDALVDARSAARMAADRHYLCPYRGFRLVRMPR